MKIKVAVIIKHLYRDSDYRVDICEIEEDDTNPMSSLLERVEKQLLGPFEIVTITEKLNQKANY